MSSYLSQFNYQLYGNSENKKIVFLHGLMGYGLNFRTIAQRLSDQYQILCFDQRGHGKSIKPATGYAPKDYAEDLMLILQELDWKKINLIGHSMGGRNALSFSYHFREYLEKLVVVDIGPDSRPEASTYYKNLLDLVPTPFRSKQEAKSFFLNDFKLKAQKFDQPETLGSYLYSNLIEDAHGQATWRFSKEAMIETVTLGRAQDHWREIQLLNLPTLWIRGANSKDLTDSEYKKILLSNSHIQGVVISNAGHWVHVDQPDIFVDEIKKFTSCS